MMISAGRTILGSLAASVLLSGSAFAADIVIGVPNWPSVNVTAHVLKVIIEDNLGLEVELQNATNPVIFEAMAKGTMDLHPEVILPNQQSLFDQYADQLAKNGHPAPAVQGICVNKAAQDAGVTDISDLIDPAKAALFDSDGDGTGEVFIGATGWGTTSIEKLKTKLYGYDQVMEILELDEGVAYSQLDAAQAADRPWAGWCYTPHHLFTLHPDLKLLQEPEHDPATWKIVRPGEDPDWESKAQVMMAWPVGEVQPVFVASLADRHPQAFALLKNLDLDDEDIGGFSYALVVEQKDPLEFARAWVADNQARIDGWLQ